MTASFLVSLLVPLFSVTTAQVLRGLEPQHRYSLTPHDHPVTPTQCSELRPTSKGDLSVPCECVLALDVQQAVLTPSGRNVSLTLPNVTLHSSGFLFAPVTVTSQCLNASGPVFLDFRPFQVFPRRENHWERIANASFIDAKVTFACHNFVHRGIYRFQLGRNGPYQELTLNATTKVPTVRFREDSIFPHCSGDFALTWELPACPLPDGTQFRIRVLAVLDGPEGAPEDWNYVEEFPASTPNANALSSMASIPCSQFDIIYKKFCFELVAVDDRTHRVGEWDRRCVFTEPLHRVDGGWAAWSSWTPCSQSCDTGLQKRVRTCTEPPPNRGNFCEGAPLEIRECADRNCTGDDAVNTTHTDPIHSADPSCRCGCALLHHEGILHVARNRRCPSGPLQWTFPRQEYTRVRLQILQETITETDVLRILKGVSKEIAWASDTSQASSVEVDLDQEVSVELEPAGHPDAPYVGGGFFVDFRVVRDAPRLLLVSREYSSQLGLSWVFGHCSTNACQHVVVVVLLVAVALVLVSLVAVPPLLCTYATKKYAGQRCESTQASEGLLTSLSQRLDMEMYRSGGTDTTQLTSETTEPVPFPVAKRSIGIQLSVQSTPRTVRSPAANSSMGSVAELEYDYYDPIVPDSLLRPYLVSEIDIDRIVDRETSGWVQSPPATAAAVMTDVTTQVDSV